jgi:hypothetical protein
MQRASTTVVVLLGHDTDRVLQLLEGAANVRVLRLEDHLSPLDRAVAATSEAASAHIPYLVHDADPLAMVADAWVRYFDEAGPRGELEVAVSETVARSRIGTLELPDYYLVLDPERLDATRRHFWLGLLYREAQARVVPVESNPADVLVKLGALTPGRWWSPLDALLAGIETEVPDQIGVNPPSDQSLRAPVHPSGAAIRRPGRRPQ